MDPVHGGLALAICVVLGIYAAQKWQNDTWGELLWGCHVASAGIAAGLVVESVWLVSLGFVFNVGLGVPAWLIRVAASRSTTLLEVLAHATPTMAALYFLLQTGVLPNTGAINWILYMGLIAASRALTHPRLNVNLAHRPSPELQHFVPHIGLARLTIVLGCLATLCCGEFAARALLGTAGG